MTLAHSPRIPTDGLIFYLDAANPRSYPGSGTSWGDMIPDKASGSMINMTSANFTEDKIGVLNFDGVNEYIDVIHPKVNVPFSPNVVSVILWYFPLSSNTKTTGTNCNLITIERSWELSIGNNQNGYSKIYYASNPWAWRGNNGNHLVNDSWNMVTFVHSLSDRKIYVDDQLMYTINDSGPLADGDVSMTKMAIMARYCCGGNYAPGKLAQVSIYEKALTEDEIFEYYRSTSGRFK